MIKMLGVQGCKVVIRMQTKVITRLRIETDEKDEVDEMDGMSECDHLRRATFFKP